MHVHGDHVFLFDVDVKNGYSVKVFLDVNDVF